MDVKRLSLSARLTLSASIVLPIILGFSAFSLDKAFQLSLLKAEQQALQAHIYSLMGASEPATEDDDESLELFVPESLAEPRFNRPQSGLIGLILNANGKAIWQSGSAFAGLTTALQDHRKDTAAPYAAGADTFGEIIISGQTYSIAMFDSIWELRGKDQLFRFVVLHTQDAMAEELASYRDALWLWLAGITVLFITAQLLITRWGLMPLKHLALALEKFQQGQNKLLEGQYPKEIAPVIENLNGVLQSEQAQRQRYKNTLSDLAHSLKTPLAIMRAELENTKTTQTATIDEQITRMAEIVQHQLQRATLTTTSSIREKTPLRHTLERLGSALSKVYKEKHVSLTLDLPEELDFPGDESDALEICGNLLENAFKYGQSTICVHAGSTATELHISIGDDGPGIATHMKQQILTRGARADTGTAVQGQGIGLAIVVDIISSYQGQLSIGESPLGGAEFRLSLPL